MMSDGRLVGDGSWNLRIFVTDLQVERVVRVKGDLHIGGVMLRLVEDLDIAMDWSDHALWWPMRNVWLTRTRATLDQCGVQADALLEFTPMHKMLRVQLPDLRFLDCRVDFSVKTFSAVKDLCKDLGIRHPEELSFQKPLGTEHLKANYGELPGRKRGPEPAVALQDTNTFIARGTANSTPEKSPGFMCAPVSSPHNKSSNASSPISGPVTPGTTLRPSGGSPFPHMNGNCSPAGVSLDALNGSLSDSLAHSPQPAREARSALLRPKSLVEKARLNVAWLDSSLSIMEQGVREYDTLNIRFKFYSFYDLNPKLDAVRINQLYEQARWQLLAEHIDCTEEEMIMFAALQLQVNLQANCQQPDLDGTGEDDIDAALTDLQVTLEGTEISSLVGDITSVPELGDYMRFMKPKRFTLKSFRRYWFVCRDLQLALYKSKEEAGRAEPAHVVSLRGCEVTPEVNITHGKYGIKLEVPSAEGMSEMLIRCDSEEQYARWMAVCRLASKGRTLADSSFDAEVRSIRDFLQMQHPAPAPAINLSNNDINVEDYIAPRFLRKLKGKLSQRILEAHANTKDLYLVEAKMQFVRAWQSLPDHGVSLFVVKFMGHKKEELLGVAFNRLMRMDINTGDHIKTWRYNTMKAWNVNWEVKHMMVQFEEGSVIFNCLSADCKVIHEFIGGYIFLSMRSKDANQTLNEELFHKLTGGWV